MECRKFQIAILSAQGLENVREIFRMKVYAQLSIPGNPEIKRETPVDTEGETNPAWNSTIGFTIGNQGVEHQGVVFVIKLYCSRTLGDRYIGEVSLSFKDLFDGAAPTSQGRSSGIVSYPVKKGGADSQGVLNFSYSFGDIVMVKKPSLFSRRNLAVAVNGVANFQNPDFCSVERETESMYFGRRRILPHQNETAALLTCYSVF
ncbi:protein SRC2-like [Vitis riparia]|uniref:protein SRC2-like n=1 Tax=Vitis riparia TaxID=96939 RepID=UPI00155A583A|nr:protein SRC2-like [Vitis riparia]